MRALILFIVTFVVNGCNIWEEFGNYENGYRAFVKKDGETIVFESNTLSERASRHVSSVHRGYYRRVGDIYYPVRDTPSTRAIVKHGKELANDSALSLLLADCRGVQITKSKLLLSGYSTCSDSAILVETDFYGYASVAWQEYRKFQLCDSLHFQELECFSVFVVAVKDLELGVENHVILNNRFNAFYERSCPFRGILDLQKIDDDSITITHEYKGSLDFFHLNKIGKLDRETRRSLRALLKDYNEYCELQPD